MGARDRSLMGLGNRTDVSSRRWLLGVAPLLGVALGVLASGCQAPVAPPEPTPPVVDPITDREGPTLETEPITAPQPADLPVVFDVTATDPSGVYVVYLHFKPQNTSWQVVRMNPDAETPDLYAFELQPDAFDGASSISYYFEAADLTAYRNTSTSPTTGESDPYKFNLSIGF